MSAQKLAKFFLTTSKALNLYYKPMKNVDRQNFKTLGGLVPYSGEGPLTQENLNKLKNTLGPSQQEMLDQAENDSKGLWSLVFLAGNKQDDVKPDELQFWGSDNGPRSHLYGVMTKSRLTDVNSVLDPNGQYALIDFSNFYDFNGVIDGNDPDNEKLREEYNKLPNSATRVKWLDTNNKRFVGKLYDMRDKKEFFKPGDWFFMGESLVQFKASGWYEATDSRGNSVKSFVMLLRPSPTHPFSRWIVHGYTTGGPNTLICWVLGGGSSKILGLDILNSFLATRMWTVTKNWSAAIADLQQRLLGKSIPGDTELSPFMGTYRPNLIRASISFGVLVGFSKLGIWLNKLRGVREPTPLNPGDKFEVQRLGSRGLDEIANQDPVGDKSYTGPLEKMTREEMEKEVQKTLAEN